MTNTPTTSSASSTISIAASGGFTYMATTSRTLSMNCGSGDSLNDSTRCGFNPVRLQPERPPNPANMRRRDPFRFRHRTTRPMRRINRFRFQRPHNQCLDLRITDLPHSTRPRLIMKAIQTIRNKPRPPLPDRDMRRTQLRSNRLVVRTGSTRQHDPGPQRQRLRRLRMPSPPLQRLRLLRT